MRESPALDVMGLLHAQGRAGLVRRSRTCRKCTAASGPGGFDIKAVDLTRGSIGQYDCVVIVTDHKAFDYDAIVAECGRHRRHAQRDQAAPSERVPARRAEARKPEREKIAVA